MSASSHGALTAPIARMAMLIFCLSAAGPGWAQAPAEAPRGATLVVCPANWRAALQAWVRLRTEQGERIVFVEPAGGPDAILGRLREASSGAARAILLIGDVETTPAWRLPAQVNVAWGSEPELASDHPYADLDGDQRPDAAVGRWSVDSIDELQAVVGKVIAYETEASHGEWRRKVHVVAGVGGFGPLIDGALQMATRHFLTNQLPDDFRLTMTHGDWKSPYCPDPRKFREVVIDRLNEGGLFWVYIGHGQRTYLDVVRTPVGGFPILDARDHPLIACRDGQPIAMFLACYAGAMDFPRESLAEVLTRDPGGPVAVLAGSRVTMPYGMAVMSHYMMSECFQRRRPTLGEMLLHAKRRMLQDAEHPPRQRDANLQMLDVVAGAISPNRDQLAAEIREHVLLFNLFGDPLLTIRHPADIEIEAPAECQAGESLVIRCRSTVAGALRAELACRRDRSTSPLTFRRTFDLAGLADYDDVYARANQHVWDRCETRVAGDGLVEFSLTAPRDAAGPGHVRVFVEGEGSHGSGAVSIYVRRGEADR